MFSVKANVPLKTELEPNFATTTSSAKVSLFFIAVQLKFTAVILWTTITTRSGSLLV